MVGSTRRRRGSAAPSSPRALTAFGDSGFHGASMAEIARRAGISHTGLLHHFPRKEDLLTAVLDLQDERSARVPADHATLRPSRSRSTCCGGWSTTLVDRDRHAGLVELGAVLTGEASAPRRTRRTRISPERYRNVRGSSTRLFARLQEEGRLSSPLPPAYLAAATIALMRRPPHRSGCTRSRRRSTSKRRAVLSRDAGPELRDGAAAIRRKS